MRCGMMRRLLILAGLALAGCSPNLGHITVTIEPRCGLGDKGQGVTISMAGGSVINARCDTTIAIDGKADPVLSAPIVGSR